MRASEYIVLVSDNTVVFDVDTEIFGDDLESLGLTENRFTATIKLGQVQRVVGFYDGEEYTEHFDLVELVDDVQFAATNEPNTFFGGELK